MSRYILNKKVEKGKMNDFEDFKDVEKVVWDFISAIYNAGWDALIVDSNSVSFRSKVSAKFILKINPPNISKSNNEKNINKPASIIRISPPILAKLPKEVNEITKYFKKNDQLKKIMNDQLKGKTRLYAQVITLLSYNTRKVLKIKETFLL